MAPAWWASAICSRAAEAEKNKPFIAIDDARLFVGIDGYPTLDRVSEIAASMDMETEVIRDIIFMRSASSE